MVLALTTMTSPNASPSRQISVVDVYDLAAAIGKDFERLIEQCGADVARKLMPKVISALETLEALAMSNERESDEIVTLKQQVERLAEDKRSNVHSRQQFEQELVQVEENYKKEIEELWAVVQQLQSENRRLGNNLVEQNNSSPVHAIKEEDLKMMFNLKQVVNQQRDQLKSMQADGVERQSELDKKQIYSDKMERQTKELQRKLKQIQGQSRVLVEEKSELIAQLQQREEDVLRLQHSLGQTQREKRDLEQTKAEESSELDRDNAPRFTLAELREVLQEKNSLKARVLELQEELDMLRPSSTPSPQPPRSDDDDMPVYGPLPREPLEKLYPWKYQRKDSGVRKFFTWRSSSRAAGETPTSSANASDSASASSSKTRAPTRRCRPTAERTTASTVRNGAFDEPIEFALDASSLTTADASSRPSPFVSWFKRKSVPNSFTVAPT